MSDNQGRKTELPHQRLGTVLKVASNKLRIFVDNNNRI